MSVFTLVNTEKLLGRDPDGLSYNERAALAGHWAALEIYTPETLARRGIAAIGDSPAACARQLAGRGLNPAKFEFSKITPPF